MVGSCLVCFQGVSGCRPGVTHDMIGHRTGSRVRVSAAVRCQLWLGQRRHGRAWQLGRVAYKPMHTYGSAATVSNSYEGWQTRPGPVGRWAKRTAFRRPSSPRRQRDEGQHRYGPCGVGPEQPRRSGPQPSLFRDDGQWTSSSTAPLLATRSTAAMLRLVDAEDLYQAPSRGGSSFPAEADNRSLVYDTQGCSWRPFDISPLLTRVHTAPKPCGTASVRDTARRNTSAEPNHPEPLVSTTARCSKRPSASINTRNC